MAVWRQLARGLRTLMNRGAADREVDEEVQNFLDESTAAYAAQGLSPEAARRAARVDLGSAAAAREEIRASGWENLVSTTLADLRYAVRQLRRAPAFASAAIVTLALALGASTAIFSAVNPVLFQTLPYPDADRILTIADRGVGGPPVDVTFGTFRELAARNRSFEALAVYKPWQPTLVDRAETERLDGQRVSADFFRVLGVSPALGRGFADLDDRFHGPNVIVISNALWRRRFGGDPSVIGRPMALDGAEYSIVGVMPSRFENVLSPAAAVWAPLQYDPSLPYDGREWGHHLEMIGRVRPDVSVARARGDLGAIAAVRKPDFARPRWADLSRGLVVESLQSNVTRGVRPALLAIAGAVLLVLVMACVNVTNLLLARGARRHGEFAMRTALGAGRSRVIRQLVAESLLLAVLGGGLGMLLAAFGVRALVAISPPGLPRVDAIRVDGDVFIFGFLLTTAVGFLVGLAPAFQTVRGGPWIGVQRGGSRVTAGRWRTRGMLVAAEVALACVLLVAAGLLLRSLQRLFAVPAGFDSSHVLTMQVVEPGGGRFAEAGERRRFFTRALDLVRGVPGVQYAGFTTQLPLSGDLDGYGAHFDTDPDAANRDPVLRYVVTPDYFRALRIPLVRGRLLDLHDDERSPRVALINQSLAAAKFGGRSALGRRVIVGPSDWYTIVGVVGDVRQSSLAAPFDDAIYIAPEQWPLPDRSMSLVVRTDGDPRALTPMLRNAVWSAGRDVAILRVAAMDDLVARTESERRFALTLFEAFGLSALLLAAVGLNGVVSGTVVERTREIGVRSALGASRSDILSLVLGQGMRLSGAGVIVGVAVSVLAARALMTLLFDVSPRDPATYALAIVTLAIVSVVASVVPAWRAARIDPAITLKGE